jgi:signal transduction histidine kinase
MFKTLYSQLVLTIFLMFGLLAAGLVYTLQYNHKINQDLANQQMHQQLAAHLASDLSLWPTSGLDFNAVKEAFHVMMIIGPAIELYVTDPEGNILAYDAPEEIIKRRQIDVNKITAFSAIEHTLNQPIYGIDPRSEAVHKVFSAAPIQQNGTLKGYLYIIIGGQEYDQVWSAISDNQNLKDMVLLALVLMLALFLCTLFIFRFITQPIKHLSQQLSTYEHSGFTQLPHIDLNGGSNDVLTLQSNVQHMAEKISTQIERLKRTDQLRKDLMIQISHDLRTPIAAQQAYLETLDIHQGQLSPDQQQHFIKQAMNNSEVVNHLVEEILQLARLENNTERFTLAPLDLVELGQNLVEKLKQLAQKKGVSLRFESNLEHALVNVDRVKIGRVINNLIENAISHCPEKKQTQQSTTDPQENIVTLSIQWSNKNIRLQVSDTGKGISEQDLPYLFEPYFRINSFDEKQADYAQKNPTQQKHLGLGLAICQRIVDLHQSTLSVKSQLGKGTDFYFDLKTV